MQVRVTRILILALLMHAACGSEQAADTQIAVENAGTAIISATVSDSTTRLDFASVAAGTTSNFQIATFASLTALEVSVGSVTSTIDLTQGMRNVVAIGPDAKVKGVSVAAIPVTSVSTGGAW